MPKYAICSHAFVSQPTLMVSPSHEASSPEKPLLGEHPLITPTDEQLLPPSEAERLANVRTTTKIGVGVALAYSLSYFWRYPIFILPKEILNQHVATVFGTKLDLQACLSMAFILGFGAAKAPMAAFVSSPTFFRRRLATLTTMLITSMLLEGVGIWAFAAHPPLQVVCVFLSSFLSSGLYGACYGAYLEGRRSTETLLAIVSGFLIYAGNLARGCASWVLSLGVPPDLMPLAIGAVACPLACALIALVHRAPGPNAADVAARSKRTPMGPAERAAFLRRFGPGLACMLLGYSMLTGARSFRDFYASQLFAASLGVASPPPYVYVVADLPGSVLACLALVALNRVADNRRCLRRMMQSIVVGAAFLALSTLLFRCGALGGVVWQMALGVGIFVTYSVYGTPFFDRLFAAAAAEGTATFLVFLADFCGYVVTIVILLLQNFGPKPAGGSSGADAAAAVLQWYTWLLYGASAAIGALTLGALAYFDAALRRRRDSLPAAPREEADP